MVQLIFHNFMTDESGVFFFFSQRRLRYDVYENPTSRIYLIFSYNIYFPILQRKLRIRVKTNVGKSEKGEKRRENTKR